MKPNLVLTTARLPVRDRLTTSCPDAILVAPIPIESKPPSTPHLQHVNNASSHGHLRRVYKLKANKRKVRLTEV